MSKLLKVNLNDSGRDFICSDIHGHFDLLESKLAEVKFDPEIDRLFSLGDLIDRGPDSIKAFEYLEQPWFYAILGNHEVMLIDAVLNPDKSVADFWLNCGGAWAKNIPESRLSAYCKTLINLPIAIEVPTSEGHFIGLVHANLPKICDWHDVTKHLSSLAQDAIPDDSLTSQFIWSKLSTLGAMDINAVENIQHVFHGHTIQSEIVTIENRTFMDLGSYLLGDVGFVDMNDFVEQWHRSIGS